MTTIVVMSSAQIGKTEILNNVVGYHVEQDPSPMLVLLPTLTLGEAWSKDRLAPMLRDTPALQGLVKDARTRDSGNTLLHKTFPGGHITIAGANSPASLSSRPIRVVLCDEVDRYPHSAGTEGDPVNLAFKRTANFWNRKKALFSTPTNEGSSRIAEAWEESDKRSYWVPCPECDTYQTLIWDQVRFKDENGQSRSELAHYRCAACESPWSEAQRLRAVRDGEWRAEATFNGTAGFHINALYSPWVDLCDLAREWLDAQQNPERLRVFVNTVKGELWSEKYHALQPEGLQARCEPYPKRGGTVLAPRGVVVMTAGVDVQDDRLEVQIQGYGVGIEQWKLQYHVLDGDPSSPHVWSALWELLQQPLPMERGGIDWVRASAVDTQGHATLQAYDFCRPRFRYATRDGRLAYVFAIRGDAGPGQVWPRDPSRNNKGKIPLYTIKVDSAKESLYGALEKIEEPGPGFIHFPSEVSTGLPFDTRYFDQLTAEKVTVRRNKAGQVARVWEKKSEGRRNEALDTSIYGEAALRGLIAMGLDLDVEAQRVAAMKPSPDEPQPAPSGAPPVPRPSSPQRRRSTSSWLNR